MMVLHCYLDSIKTIAVIILGHASLFVPPPDLFVQIENLHEQPDKHMVQIKAT